MILHIRSQQKVYWLYNYLKKAKILKKSFDMPYFQLKCHTIKHLNFSFNEGIFTPVISSLI